MIHPRRLKGGAGNIARYFATGDYYTKGRMEPSAWGGRIAEELGLSGRVDPKIFQRLLDGRVGDQRLGRHRADGEIQHQPGWDFAVNAPKSVSIMALVMGDERILDAHEKAVGAAIDYLEEHAALRRRDSGSIVHETTGRLLVARFTEHASRALDPHLHTHVVVMNMTNGGDGKPMASLETRAMFVEQMTAGQVYRNALAHRVRELGYAIDYHPRHGLFEISGIPRDLLRAMSRRAAEIDAHARDHGHEGQAARRGSFYATRPAKEAIGGQELHSQWLGRAELYRASLERIATAAKQQGERSIEAAPATAARATLFGIRQAEGREAVNNLGQIYRYALSSHVGDVRLDDIRRLVEEHADRFKLLSTGHATGSRLLTRGRTTRRTARLEIGFAYQLALGIDDARPVSGPARINEVLAQAGLNPAQEHALRHIGLSSDRLVGVHGVAGAGKSTLIRALVLAADPGRRFIGLAPTSSAAASLGQGAGIEFRTVASLIASGVRTIDADHVLVIDEAGQLGNRQVERLLEMSRLSGARLIFLGDNKQTGAIEQGKAFFVLQRLGLSVAQLPESVRQETRAMKAAVTQARLGDYAASLHNLDKLVSGIGKDRLADDLVATWMRLQPSSREATNILVLDNASRLVVNHRIRSVLREEGGIAREEKNFSVLAAAGLSAMEKRFARFYEADQVVRFGRDIPSIGIVRDSDYVVAGHVREGRREFLCLIDAKGDEVRWDPRTARSTQVSIFIATSRSLAAGDRIQWRQVNRQLDLRNAERGTVEAILGPHVTIRWDRGNRRQTVDLSIHRTWDHGYAETVYSAQSKTYDRVYVLAPVHSPLVNGQNYYTAITRARFGVKLWTEDVGRLTDRLRRDSGEKSSALEGLGKLPGQDVGAPIAIARPDVERLREDTLRLRRNRRGGTTSSVSQVRTPAEWMSDRARGLAERLTQLFAAGQDRDAAASVRPAERGGRA